MADAVLRYLRDLGLEPDEDGAGPEIGSSMGNVYARLEPTAAGTPLFFCAHLDTVPPSGPLEPIVDDGIVRNAGGTILGADNKSAVVQMLEGVRRVLAENRPHAGIELADGTRAREAYDEAVIFERHRHRYEVNNLYRERLVEAGLVVSGTFEQGRLVEIVELPEHPWFVASQFHPEFKSRPTRPASLFRDFVGAAVIRSRQRAGVDAALA